MYAVDFEYDGEYLSNYGFIICDFNASRGADIVDSGSQINFNVVPLNSRGRFSLIGTKYDKCIQSKFHICKDPDKFDDLEITEDEFRDINRWLNRNEFLRFQLLSCENGIEPYYFASFNINKIKISEVLYGIELSLTTNSPFGFGETETKRIVIETANAEVPYLDMSDEIGYIYPTIMIAPTITQGSTVTVTIKNEFGGNDISTTVIKGCTHGEIITIDGDKKTISSTVSGHNINADFNYNFFKICNTFNDRLNTITSNVPCTITMTFTPVIKNSI